MLTPVLGHWQSNPGTRQTQLKVYNLNYTFAGPGTSLTHHWLFCACSRGWWCQKSLHNVKLTSRRPPAFLFSFSTAFLTAKMTQATSHKLLTINSLPSQESLTQITRPSLILLPRRKCLTLYFCLTSWAPSAPSSVSTHFLLCFQLFTDFSDL
jgi:hypothetical protein